MQREKILILKLASVISFGLFMLYFFEELHDKVMMSEEAASRADLEVGLVGHKSPSGSLYI